MLRAFLRILELILMLVLMAAPPVVAADEEEGAAITIEPSSGPVGTQVQVNISGFRSGEPVEISFGMKSTVVSIVTTDEWGDGTATFTVKTCPAGRYRVGADDEYFDESYVYFTIEPKISLDKSSGWVGENVVVKGTGFAASSPVTVYFDDLSLATDETATVETGEDGTFSNISFSIPESCKGSHTVKVVDSKANYGTDSIVTKQKVIIAPTSGAAGSEISIAGTGFEADKDVVVYFNGEDLTGTLTNEKGSFSTTFRVPTCGIGDYKVKVSDGANRYYEDFTVTAGIKLIPTTGNVGTYLTVQGIGFRVGVPVIVTYDGAEMAKSTANLDGAFSATFGVPPSQAGKHTVTASDGDSTIKAVFTMESTPPPIPELILPAEASEVAAGAVYLDWGSVPDPSGVSYALVIASDANLSDVLLTKERLTDSEYTLSGDEMLPATETPYYWRVRAIDGASNMGEWSGTGSFYVGFSFALAMPDWTKYSLMGLGLILLCFLCFWLGNRLKNP